MELVVLVLALVGGCLAQPVSPLDNTVDITGETVKQVETLIAQDPKLPRLTRGEIVSLIHEVRNISSQRGDKSLLVVLPVNNGTQQLEELYNKEAVTQYLGEPPMSTTSRPKRRRKKPTQPRPVYVHSSPEPQTSAKPTRKYTTAAYPPLIHFTTSKPNGFENTYNEDLTLPDTMKETLVEISVSPTAEPPVFVTPHKTTRPTAPPVPSDVQNTADALSPDIKQVLNSIGIFGEKTTEKPIFELKAVAPSIDPSTFSRFKPLPIKGSEGEVSDDMKSFLKSFGLLEPPSRQMKAMRESEEENEKDFSINEYILTDDMKSILRNIGLLDRKSKKVHVFNPQVESSKLNQTEHMIKINKVLKKLREVSEGGSENVSQEELKELLELEGGDEYNKTLLDSELDPALENGDQYQSLESTKNEVKRQQPNDTIEVSTDVPSNSNSASASASANASSIGGASGSASASASSDEDTTAATEDTTSEPVLDASSVSEPSAEGASDSTARTPSLDDLADSFGGADVTTRRPNGFYFLLDWNSFLDVGLDERKISLNFSPKVGDPKNFLPVTFP